MSQYYYSMCVLSAQICADKPHMKRCCQGSRVWLEGGEGLGGITKLHVWIFLCFFSKRMRLRWRWSCCSRGTYPCVVLCRPKWVTFNPLNGLVVVRENMWESIVHLCSVCSVHPTTRRRWTHSDGVMACHLFCSSFFAGLPLHRTLSGFLREGIAWCALSVSRPALSQGVKHVVIVLLPFHMSQLTGFMKPLFKNCIDCCWVDHNHSCVPGFRFSMNMHCSPPSLRATSDRDFLLSLPWPFCGPSALVHSQYCMSENWCLQREL